MKKLILFLSFILGLSKPILPQVTWLQCPGVYGGDVRCYAISSNGTTYMGSNGTGLYKTLDNGNNWSRVNIGILNLNVRALAINTSDHIFAGIFDNTGSGILRSTNYGVNWNYTALTGNDIRTISINPEGYIFVGTESLGIYRSTDNGISYTQVNNGLTNQNIRSIAFKSRGVTFTATYAGGMFESTDNGEDWFQVNTGLPNLFLNTVAVNPVNGYIFAGLEDKTGNGAVYGSTNNGGIWTRKSSFTNTNVLQFVISPSGTLYAGTIFTYANENITYLSVFRSTDGGGNWGELQCGYGYAGLAALVLNNTLSYNGFYSYVGANYTIERSINNKNYKDTCTGFTGNIVSSLFIPNSNGRILAGTKQGGIYRSIDGGINWDRNNYYYLPVATHNAFAVNSNNIIYSVGNRVINKSAYIVRSQDNGDHWSEVWSPSTTSTVCALTINYLNYIFMGTLGTGIYRSINNGDTWTQINLSNNNVWSLLSVDSTISIFAGTGDGKIFRSMDNGLSFIQVYVSPITSSTTSVKSIAKSPDNTIYAGLDTGGIIFSKDNGTTWMQSGFTSPNVNTIVFNSNGHIFAGTGENGVYRSIDNGASWVQENKGFINTKINALALDAAGYIYSGNNGGSVYKSLESTVSIHNISTEIPSKYSLSQNYPNPFNPTTKIRFAIPTDITSQTSNVKIIIFDILGKEIETLVNEQLIAGTYETQWNASSYPSGVYFYKLSAGDFSETKKMLMIK
jgi:photosystem II stability/assembly factor-like uncharacterized protein